MMDDPPHNQTQEWPPLSELVAIQRNRRNLADSRHRRMRTRSRASITGQRSGQRSQRSQRVNPSSASGERDPSNMVQESDNVTALGLKESTRSHHSQRQIKCQSSLMCLLCYQRKNANARKEGPWNKHCTVFFVACKANGFHPIRYLQSLPREEKIAPPNMINENFEIQPIQNMSSHHFLSINECHDMCVKQWEITCNEIREEFGWKTSEIQGFEALRKLPHPPCATSRTAGGVLPALRGFKARRYLADIVNEEER